MTNGLILRFHDTSSAMWIELRTPRRGGDQGTTIGIISRLQNPRTVSEEQVAKRARIFELAKRLQPSTMEALAAIRDTINLDPGRASAPSVPYPYPMATGPPRKSPLEYAKARAYSKSATVGLLPKLPPVAKQQGSSS